MKRYFRRMGIIARSRKIVMKHAIQRTVPNGQQSKVVFEHFSVACVLCDSLPWARASFLIDGFDIHRA